MTAIHCPEYTAKPSATHQGPGLRKVSARRGRHPPPAADVPTGAFGPSAGTPYHTAAQARAETSPRSSHHSGQEAQAITQGPSSKPMALPSGM